MNGNRLDEKIYIHLEQEQFLHRDMVLSESPGGINFARRYLWIINWANRNYKFDFLLRVDDDYFICMDRLFLELPYRKIIKKLYWGHVHCYPPGKYQKFKHSRKLIDWLFIRILSIYKEFQFSRCSFCSCIRRERVISSLVDGSDGGLVGPSVGDEWVAWLLIV